MSASRIPLPASRIPPSNLLHLPPLPRLLDPPLQVLPAPFQPLHTPVPSSRSPSAPGSPPRAPAPRPPPTSAPSQSVPPFSQLLPRGVGEGLPYPCQGTRSAPIPIQTPLPTPRSSRSWPSMASGMCRARSASAAPVPCPRPAPRSSRLYPGGTISRHHRHSPWRGWALPKSQGTPAPRGCGRRYPRKWQSFLFPGPGGSRLAVPGGVCLETGWFGRLSPALP